MNKNLILNIIVTLFLLNPISFSQEMDSHIQLTAELGDTIHSYENEHYNLYHNIDGFEYATGYLRDSKHLIFRIVYSYQLFCSCRSSLA